MKKSGPNFEVGEQVSITGTGTIGTVTQKGDGAFSVLYWNRVMSRHEEYWFEASSLTSVRVAMGEIKDGGPAFPHPNPDYAPDHHTHNVHRSFGGMSLRDWFAGQAMMGAFILGRATGNTCKSIALDAYRQADAMLAARDGGGQ